MLAEAETEEQSAQQAAAASALANGQERNPILRAALQLFASAGRAQEEEALAELGRVVVSAESAAALSPLAGVPIGAGGAAGSGVAMHRPFLGHFYAALWWSVQVSARGSAGSGGDLQAEAAAQVSAHLELAAACESKANYPVFASIAEREVERAEKARASSKAPKGPVVARPALWHLS